MQRDLEAHWMAAMRSYEFERAWRISDEVGRGGLEKKHSGPRHLQNIWRGEGLRDARVLVRCYHGLGDTLQFIRFATPLRRLAREVIVWCQPGLLDLIARVHGVDRALPLHDGTPDVEFDVDIEVMELPYALRLTGAELGKDVPYLRCSTDAPKSAGLLHVGLAWQASGWDLQRSISADALSLLTAVPNIRFYSLQPADCRGLASVMDCSSLNIDALATFMSGLDLIVSVDTMAAHLAGGLGLPVWTLLRSGCDWRWGVAGCSTPWYPTMRLFRQSLTHDWTRPISEMVGCLQELSAQCSRANTGTNVAAERLSDQRTYVGEKRDESIVRTVE